MMNSNLNERRLHKPSQRTEQFEAAARQDEDDYKGSDLAALNSSQRQYVFLSFIVGFVIGVAAFSFTWLSTFLLVQHTKTRGVSPLWRDPRVLVFSLAFVSVVVFYTVLFLQSKCVDGLSRRVKNSKMTKRWDSDKPVLSDSF